MNEQILLYSPISPFLSLTNQMGFLKRMEKWDWKNVGSVCFKFKARNKIFFLSFFLSFLNNVKLAPTFSLSRLYFLSLFLFLLWELFIYLSVCFVRQDNVGVEKESEDSQKCLDLLDGIYVFFFVITVKTKIWSPGHSMSCTACTCCSCSIYTIKVKKPSVLTFLVPTPSPHRVPWY